LLFFRNRVSVDGFWHNDRSISTLAGYTYNDNIMLLQSQVATSFNSAFLSSG
jgi:hypothetical protein